MSVTEVGGLSSVSVPAAPPAASTAPGALISVLAIGLASDAAVAQVARADVISGLFLCAFLLVGVASVPLVLFPDARESRLELLVAGLASTLGLLVAGGFLMIELRWWHPVALEIIVGAVICAIHLRNLDRADLRGAVRSDVAFLSRHLRTPHTGLSLAGLAICVITGALQYPLSPGRLGMMSTLSPVWYVGFAICAGVVADLLRRSRRPGFSSDAFAVPCVVLVGLISLTTSIVYPEPRFVWVAKHIGVTEYLAHVHAANVPRDIYQAWPGLFAGAAWLGEVGRIGDPLTIARWFPAAADIVTALGVCLLGRRLLRSPSVGWGAAVLFGLALAFGQDYFSPQALGLLFAMAIFGLAVGRSDLPRSFELGVIVFLSLCLAVTHQLSPYPVFGALLVLTLFRLVRPWWVSLAVLVPAVGWAAAHSSTWSSYFSSGVGDLASNTSLASISGESFPQAKIVHVANYTLGVGLLLVGLFALMELIAHRDRLHLALALCAISPLALLAATNYGGEADNRVVFFAMPWLAVLAANWWHTSRVRDWMIGVLPLLLSASSYVAVTGLDWAYVESPASVAAERYAERHAGPDTAITVAGSTDGVPVELTDRYPRLKFLDLSAIEIIPQVQRRFGSDGDVARLPKLIAGYTGDQQAEVISTDTSARYDELKGIQTIAGSRAFVAAMNRSSRWKVVFRSGGAIVWRLKGNA
jgi:hypothetical protein